jgi:hypothetical protein
VEINPSIVSHALLPFICSNNKGRARVVELVVLQEATPAPKSGIQEIVDET